MAYLLDTCILSTLRKNNNKKLEKWVNNHAQNLLYISVLSLGEIQSGITKLSDQSQQQKTNLEDWLFGDLIPYFQDRILPLDTQIMLTWGKLNGRLKSNGYILPFFDGLIAATALQHNLMVITSNTKDFERTGVELLDPCKLS